MTLRVNLLPYQPLPNYSQTISIDGYQYEFVFRWNRRTQCHFFSVRNNSGVIIPNQALLVGEKMYAHNLPSNTSWFLFLVGGDIPFLDKPSDYTLAAMVFEDG